MSTESPNKLVKTRYGPFLVNGNDARVGRSLQTYGEWGESELSLLRQILRPGDLAIDVGAHIGVHTVSFAQAVGPSGRVFAIEPQRILCQMLCANVQMQSLFNVIVTQGAAAATSGQAIVPMIDYMQPGDFAALRLGAYENGERVPSFPLDELPINACRLVKIDVEGNELGVLQGARKLLLTHRPVVFVEANRPEDTTAMFELLVGLKYRLFWHLDFFFNKANSRGVTEDIFGGAFDVNIIGVPANIPLTATNLTPVDGPRDTWQEAMKRSKGA